jgi:hypothetical protein
MAGEGKTKVAEEGVGAPVNTEISGRDESGRWLKGFTGNPSGRPPKEWSRMNMEAMMNAFTPEEKQRYLRTAARIAEEQGSARGIVAVFEFIEDRLNGRPTVHVMQESNNLHAVLGELGIVIDE